MKVGMPNIDIKTKFWVEEPLKFLSCKFFMCVYVCEGGRALEKIRSVSKGRKCRMLKSRLLW